MYYRKFLIFSLVLFNIFLVNATIQSENTGNNYFYYDVNNNSFSIYPASSVISNPSLLYLVNKGYVYHFETSPSIIRNWLTTQKCIISKQGNNIIVNNFDFTGLKLDVKNFLKGNSVYTLALDKNLWMKTKVTYTLISPLGTPIQGETDTKQILVDDDGTPIPTTHKFTPAYVQDKADSRQEWGNYKVVVSAIPIDLKCDFTPDGGLTPSEVQGFDNQFFQTITTQEPDSDQDGVADSSDLCPGTSGGTSVNSKGCTQADVDSDYDGVCNSNKLPFSDGAFCSGSDLCPQTNGFSGNAGSVTIVDTLANGGVNSKGCTQADVDSDFDQVCNFPSLSVVGGTTTPFCSGSDACPTIQGEVQRGGCPAYTKDICKGDTIQIFFDRITTTTDFDGTYLSCDDSGMNENSLFNYYEPTYPNYDNCLPDGTGDEANSCSEKDGEGLIIFTDSINNLKPNSGTGRYVCFNKDKLSSDDIIGYCDLTFHPALSASSCTGPGGSNIVSGTSKRYFEKDIYRYNESVRSQNRFCNDGNLNGTYTYSNYLQLGPDTQGTLLDTINKQIVYNDSLTRLKVKYDIENDKLYFIGKDATQILIPNTVPQTNKNIKIYKQGVLDREEAVDPNIIALHAHKIRIPKNANEMKQFVDKSAGIMQKFDIIKNLTYNSVTNITQVQIKVQNVPQAQQTNLTIYQVIPKELARSLNDINFISDGGAQRIILDKDPVIGWYFNDSGSNGSVEYGLPGNNEGGTIIITQEPILFNEGELIINYREGGCNPDETALFELEDLENSKIYTVGSGQLYTVCIAHLTQTLYANTGHNPSKHIMSYTTASNASIDDSYGVSSVDLSVDQTNPKIYWDLKVQETNPTGNYSCLGSVENNQNSLFGDCGFTNNRIWLHLGEDYFPPNTTLNYPYLSHSVRVELNAVDNIGGSGVDKTFYCYDDTGNCNPIQEYTGPFTITCEHDWGCIKFIRFYSTDLEGNQETIKTGNIRILDKGSACSPDCTGKPSPNRYLKECRNLNSCEYYPLPTESSENKGLYVSEQCDFLIKDSWVSYNATHDVRCPNGPVRLSKFTHFGVDNSKSSCNNIIKTPYITLFDGEQVIMNVLSCVN